MKREEKKENGLRPHYLVSACLLGEACKYSGDSNYNQTVIDYLSERQAVVIPVCPEVLGGLPTPRTPSEIRDGRVITKDGRDVTEEFQAGAKAALRAAREHQCCIAVLKERSPSCGSRYIYDGTFTGTIIKGDGVTARLLKEAGLQVIGESKLAHCQFIGIGPTQPHQTVDPADIP